VAKVFAGEIKDWSELGGEPGPIAVYAAEAGTGIADMFEALVLAPRGRQIVPGAKRLRSGTDLAHAVAKDPAGIGFASFANRPLAKPVSIRESCGIAHAASEFAVKSREYPLTRPLLLYAGKPAGEHATGLIEFALSPPADFRIEELGFVNRGITSAPYEDFHDLVANALAAAPEDFDIELMRQLQKDLGAGKRLSVTVRFEKGSERPDADSLQALGRVAAYLTQEKLGGRKLILAGFSDTSGDFDRNRDLSYQRAAGVREALLPSLGTLMKPEDVEARGYGELMPIACNDSDAGRERNRRVEIWLVPAEHARPVVLIKRL
jgi:phosphate transport system substrate-binding protein